MLVAGVVVVCLFLAEWMVGKGGRCLPPLSLATNGGRRNALHHIDRRLRPHHVQSTRLIVPGLWIGLWLVKASLGPGKGWMDCLHQASAPSTARMPTGREGDDEDID